MAATLRELRGRIRSAGSIKKITKAQELIATSRIAKAQARVQAARPYSQEITSMLTELASASALDHPLLVQRESPKRAGVLVVSSDRGLCGAYNANVLRQSEELFSLLREEGKTPVIYAADETFAIGGLKVLRESAADVATVIGAGITVFEALKGVLVLAKQHGGAFVLAACAPL